jgi:hypothetical protein
VREMEAHFLQRLSRAAEAWKMRVSAKTCASATTGVRTRGVESEQSEVIQKRTDESSLNFKFRCTERADDDLPEPKPAEREDRAECCSVMSGEQKIAEMALEHDI